MAVSFWHYWNAEINLLTQGLSLFWSTCLPDMIHLATIITRSRRERAVISIVEFTATAKTLSYWCCILVVRLCLSMTFLVIPTHTKCNLLLHFFSCGDWQFLSLHHLAHYVRVFGIQFQQHLLEHLGCSSLWWVDYSGVLHPNGFQKSKSGLISSAQWHNLQ